VPYLQFLNGGRDQQAEELNAAASLVVGSGDEAHIRLSDGGVEGRHCQVYPGQGTFWLQDLGTGSTILHMKRLKGTTEGLKDKDIFIVGTTFVKFWADKPPAGGGGGASPAAAAPSAPGVNPAALEAAKREVQAARDEAAKEKSAAQARTGKLEGDLEKARSDADSSKRELEASKRELETSKREVESTKRELESTKAAVTRVEGERDEAAGKRRALEEAQSELQERTSAAEAAVGKAKADAAAEVEKAKADAAAELQKARADVAAEAAELRAATDASRGALEALKGREEARGRDPLAALAAPSDLAKLFDALALPDVLRRRLDDAVRTEVDREALRRAAGPVVPLRGLRVPGTDQDVEALLGAAKVREAQVDAARSLGLHGLEAAELERLLELARA
jgi:DNA repair exonuclease SbcCD ATPase subunit